MYSFISGNGNSTSKRNECCHRSVIHIKRWHNNSHDMCSFCHLFAAPVLQNAMNHLKKFAHTHLVPLPITDRIDLQNWSVFARVKSPFPTPPFLTPKEYNPQPGSKQNEPYANRNRVQNQLLCLHKNLPALMHSILIQMTCIEVRYSFKLFSVPAVNIAP